MEGKKYKNRLISESSPYLQMHAHNPVDWYPWGEEALDTAKKEGKLLIISIGYAACHWCHVMEEESFADEEVAELMNNHFVSIKVDREERPDIDQVYMNAAHLLTGRAGWPLNVIALPDGSPIYAGTYFPKMQWMSILSEIYRIYMESPGQIEQKAQEVTRGIQRMGLFSADQDFSDFKLDDLHGVVRNWMKSVDFTWGGHRGVPKFPMPVGLQFLLHYYYTTRDEQVLRAVKVTLDRMARGGIFDQIGGGFSRYSVDSYWKVPHFEKMLYDNGQMVSLYSAAYLMMKDELYKSVVYGILEFVKRELMSPEGGFYSALDADSEGEEGKYYVWREEEFDVLFGDQADLIKAYYGVSSEGNWGASKNVLFREEDDATFASRMLLGIDELQRTIGEAGEKLMAIRSRRIPPSVDTKILTAWNGMMLKGFVDAYRTFHESQYLDVALKNGHFIVGNMLSEDHRLNRSFKDGKSSVNGFLDDYCFTIDAFIALYQVTFDETWLERAGHLLDYALRHFFNPDKDLFYYKSDLDTELIARNVEVSDDVIPASNSVMAHHLFTLGHYFSNEDYIEKARRMLGKLKSQLTDGGAYYANWSRLMLRIVTPVYEVAIAGEDCLEKRKEMDKYFLPGMILLGSSGESQLPLLKNKFKPGETTIYVCKDKICQQPVNEVADALARMKNDFLYEKRENSWYSHSQCSCCGFNPCEVDTGNI